MEEQYIDQRRLVNDYVLRNQTILVNKLLQSGYISLSDLNNSNKEDAREIFEWWLIEPTLVNMLLDKDEVVVTEYNSHWWGRTTTGAPIYQDRVIEEIAEEFYSDPDTDRHVRRSGVDYEGRGSSPCPVLFFEFS